MKFEFKPLQVPSTVYVNLFNGGDYQPIPLCNITDDQLDKLVDDFINGIYKVANKPNPFYIRGDLEK